MSKKGYGNVSTRFAKYFARHKNSSGPHDPKNAKQQALEKAWEEQDLFTAPPEEVFDVGEKVRVIAGEREGEYGRIAIRRQDKGDMSYGIVFDWDVAMIPFYVSGNQIERDYE
jgi:transcription antitermination factor NusG